MKRVVRHVGAQRMQARFVNQSLDKGMMAKARGEFMGLMNKLSGGRVSKEPAATPQYHIGASDASELCVKVARLLNTIDEAAVDVTRAVNDILSVLDVNSTVDARVASIMKQDTRFLEIIDKLAKSSSETDADVIELLNTISLCSARSSRHHLGIACVTTILDRYVTDPADTATYTTRLAAHYNNTYQYEKALELCSSAMSSTHQGPECYTQQAYAMYKLEDYDGALSVLKEMKPAMKNTKVPFLVRTNAIAIRNAAQEALQSRSDPFEQLAENGELWVSYPAMQREVATLRKHASYHGLESTVGYLDAALAAFSKKTGRQVKLFVPYTCMGLAGETLQVGERGSAEEFMETVYESEATTAPVALVAETAKTRDHLRQLAEAKSLGSNVDNCYLKQLAGPVEFGLETDIEYELDGQPRMRIQ